MKTTLIIFFLLILFLPNIFAEHSPHFSIEGPGSDRAVFSPDGQTLASGGGVIRLWDVKTGQNKQRLREGSPNITFSPDGQTLASGGSNNTIRLWDVKTGKHKATLSGYAAAPRTDLFYDLAFSPDGDTLASGGSNNTVRLWDANTGKHKATLKGHEESITSVAFSPDGDTLASGAWDDTVRLWDVKTGKLMKTLERVGAVKSVAFSPDGETLAANTSGRIFLWDANTGALKTTLGGPVGETSELRFSNIAFSPDGRTLASGALRGNYKRAGRVIYFDETDSAILLWDIDTGKPKVHVLTHDFPRYVGSVDFSPDGETLVYVYRGRIHLWDIVRDQRIYSIFRHRSTDLAFSPDGQTLVSGGERFILWDPLTRHQKRVLGVNSLSQNGEVAFSSDGEILATGGGWDDTIHLWDPNTGTRQKTLTFPKRTPTRPAVRIIWIEDMVFSPNGESLASVGDGITLWNVKTGERKAWRGYGDRFNGVAFSPDGQILATTTVNDATHLWDANTLQHKYQLERSGVYSIVFSPDGRTIAGDGGHSIHLWDVKTGLLKTASHDGGHGVISTDIVFSPDGRTIATRGWIFINTRSPTIDLWDANTGQRKTTLTATSVFNDPDYHDSEGIAFSPDGRTIASGGEDSIIRLWELPTTHVNITPYPVASPAIGEQFTVNLSIVEGENVGGYQFTVGFDEAILRYVGSANGDYLPPGSFFVPPVVSENAVTLSATSLTGTRNGDGTLATVTFEVLDVKESPIALSDVILTDSTGKHLSILTNSGRIEPTLPSTSAVVDLTPSSVPSPAIGERLAFNIRISEGQNVAGYQVSLEYDIKALKPVLAGNGVYLPDVSPAKPLISKGLVTLGASSATSVGNGNGVLATITFEVLVVQASTVNVSGYLTTPNGLRSTPTFKNAKVITALLGDVNRDGTVNILDLVLVGSSFGKHVPETGNPADVNEDGVINVVDLVTVAGAIGSGVAAPSLQPQALAALTASDVQQWLTQAQYMELNDPISQRGIRFLEQLLAALIPKETALLMNYPNPFNPETWIPYQLAKPADVTLTIYAIDGTVVHTLALGHQPVGIYQDKSRAAYWDGRNEVGESVASGVYFYTLTAGDFTATRKMLIRK